MSVSLRNSSITRSVRRELDECDDRDLIPVFSIVWVASVARVLAAVACGETLGTEATLALLAVLLIPWLLAKIRKNGEDAHPAS
jgi:hypothetical protein